VAFGNRWPAFVSGGLRFPARLEAFYSSNPFHVTRRTKRQGDARHRLLQISHCKPLIKRWQSCGWQRCGNAVVRMCSHSGPEGKPHPIQHHRRSAAPPDHGAIAGSSRESRCDNWWPPNDRSVMAICSIAEPDISCYRDDLANTFGTSDWPALKRKITVRTVRIPDAAESLFHTFGIRAVLDSGNDARLQLRRRNQRLACSVSRGIRAVFRHD
jgi:hypothetical protein